MELSQLLLVLLILSFLVILAGGQLKSLQLLATPSAKVAFLMVCQTAFYLIFLGLLRQRLREGNLTWSAAFGFKSTGLSRTLVVAFGFLAASLVPVGLTALGTRQIFKALHWPFEPQPVIALFLNLNNPWLKAALVVLTVVGAPVVEEILFRGLIYPCLKQRLGLPHALWISSVLFAAIHFHAPSAAPLFVLAALFVLLYERTGSLAPCIAMHAGFNALSLALLFLTRNAPF